MSPSSPKITLVLRLQEDGCFQNTQLNLFQNFLCNSEPERQRLSNSVGLWDVMPKFSISPQEMNALRDENGLLGLLHREFDYRKNRYQLVIQPALIEKKSDDGTVRTVAYYPSANEELVEEVLRKFSSEQQCGFFDGKNRQGGVIFSIYQLRQELKKWGHTRSFSEVLLSLNILSASHIKIILAAGEGQNVKAFRSTSYFQEVSGVTRKDLDIDPNAKWLVVFHPLVAGAIADSSYRQFNYASLMTHRSQITRWIHRLLVDKYVFASWLRPFSIRYSTIKRDSALLNNFSRERSAREACKSAIEELVENGLLSRFTTTQTIAARGKVLDVEFTLYPSHAFVAEVKAASSRKNNPHPR